MAFTCHVTCGDFKKVITFTNRDTVLAEICNAFNQPKNTKIRLQRYENMWNDWVDIHNICELENGMRLRQVLPEKSTNFQSPTLHTPGSDSTVILEDDTDDSSIFDSLESLPMFGASCGGSRNPCEDYISTQSRSSIASSLPSQTLSSPSTVPSDMEEVEISQDEDCSNQNETVHSGQWPKVFKIPKMPKKLSEKMRENVFPGERERRLIVNLVFMKMSEYVVYPTSEQYTEVASALVREYPVLGNENFSSAPYLYWKTKIMDKYRNERRHLPPEKRKKTAMPSGSSQAKKTCNSEDMESLKRHEKWLIEEAKKSKKDNRKVQLLMQKTFMSRRSDITENPQKLELLKQKYPFLFSTEQIKEEFSRITGVEAALRDLPVAILNHIKDENQDIMKLHTDALTRLHDPEEIANVRRSTTLMVLPSHLKEKISNFMLTTSQEAPGGGVLKSEPIIVADGEDFLQSSNFSVISENMKICETKTLTDAFECLLAAYYCFNMTYPKNILNTMTFLEKLVGLEKKRIPRRVATFYTQLKSM